MFRRRAFRSQARGHCFLTAAWVPAPARSRGGGPFRRAGPVSGGPAQLLAGPEPPLACPAAPAALAALAAGGAGARGRPRPWGPPPGRARCQRHRTRRGCGTTTGSAAGTSSPPTRPQGRRSAGSSRTLAEMARAERALPGPGGALSWPGRPGSGSTSTIGAGLPAGGNTPRDRAAHRRRTARSSTRTTTPAVLLARQGAAQQPDAWPARPGRRGLLCRRRPCATWPRCWPARTSALQPLPAGSR